MSRSFLALCQDVVSDLGVKGGTLASVTGTALSLEQQNVVKWVARADLFVSNLWVDWAYLWRMDEGAKIASGTRTLTPSAMPSGASRVQTLDITSVWASPGTDDAYPMRPLDWDSFYRMFVVRPAQDYDTPRFFSTDPNGVIHTDVAPTADVPVTMAYFMAPKLMAANADESLIPTRFDRIIVERAKLFYAERENAQEILTGSTAEYTDMLDKMEAFYLPNQSGHRRASNSAATTPQAYVE